MNGKKLKWLWESMRPHQWLKNVFILSGLLFGHAVDKLEYIFPVVLSLIAFTLVASAGYIFNDLSDREVDAKHPQKSSRPIASGKVSVYSAIRLMISLWVIGLALGFCISFKAFITLLSYVLLTTAYSIRLKNIPWVEMICIVTGFVLRVLLGTWGVGILPSIWIIACSFLLSLFLILAKRRSEQLLFKDQACRLRKVLNAYKEKVLNTMLYSAAFLCFLTYTLYAMAHGVILSVIFVAMGIGRFLFLLQLRCNQSIELDVSYEFLHDSILQMSVVLWLCMLMGFSMFNG